MATTPRDQNPLLSHSRVWRKCTEYENKQLSMRGKLDEENLESSREKEEEEEMENGSPCSADIGSADLSSDDEGNGVADEKGATRIIVESRTIGRGNRVC